MDEIAVAIIVGLCSGALGSLLGPIVAYRLRRRERREERDREIHSELRHMIEEMVDECGRDLGTAFRIYAHVRHLKLSPFDAYNRAMAERWEKERDRPYHRWEAYRITDERLKSLANELLDATQDLGTHLVAVMTIDLDRWWTGVTERERRLREIERQVKLRLDELRW